MAFLFLIVAISQDSIDLLESQTWYYARLENVSTLCNELRKDDNKVSQMPLGIFSAWAWSRAFGTSEVALRSLNLLWAAVALAALALAGRQLSIPWLPALFAIQPFVWFSMNAARTPVMEMAGGSLLLLGTVGCLRRKPFEGLAGIPLCLGAILLSGASIQGLMPLLAVLTGLTANGLWNRLRRRRSGRFFLLLTGGFVALLGIYYTVIFLREGVGTQLWRVSPANLLFVGYEFLGLQGLGPGRQDLRAVMKGLSPLRQLLPFIPGLLVFLALYLALFAAALKSWVTRDLTGTPSSAPQAAGQLAPGGERLSLLRVWLFGIGVPLQSAIVLFVLAVLSGFAFWGRHLSGAFPFWIAALAVTICWARQGLWRKGGRLVCSGILILLLFSSLLIRFAPQHRNDDYRQAAGEAMRLSAGGLRVWWVADYSGGIYYGVPLEKTPDPRSGQILFYGSKVSGPLPGAIILSRPDTFDPSGTVTKLLASGMYAKKKTLQAFEVWQKTPP